MHKDNPPAIIFRVDAFAGIGTGHLMRCLALAQAWKDARRGKVAFITYCESKRLLALLRKEKFTVHKLKRPHPHASDWNLTKKVLASAPGCWVVLDGYHFSGDYQVGIKKMGNRLLVIDDIAGLDHYYADIVLNQNLYAAELKYNHEPNTRLLCGTKYVLLRREFIKRIGFKKHTSDVATKLLVTLGGVDRNNLSQKILVAIQALKLEKSEVVLIIGHANKNFNRLRMATRKTGMPTKIIRGTHDMPKYMAWADMAISSGGTTVWELAFMGVPSLIGSTAPIEEYLQQAIRKHGIFIGAGSLRAISRKGLSGAIDKIAHDKDLRIDQSALERQMVDGYGCKRVLDIMGGIQA
jgi:UDP-2,4-diacetamido-2,4,6-trideoxy-beta-L-altropyranose hydrolase